MRRKNCRKWNLGSFGRVFDGAGSWSFGEDFARNVVIFDADNNSSSQRDNRKNIFLVLSEGSTDDINGNVGTIEQIFGMNFSKAKQRYA